MTDSALKPTIMIVIDSMTMGGAERVFACLADELAARDREVSVVLTRNDLADFYTLGDRVKRTVLPVPGGGNAWRRIWACVRRVKLIRGLLRKERPSYVVGVMTGSAVSVCLASLLLPVRVVTAERNYPPSKATALPWRLLRYILYRRCWGHVAQTNAVASYLEHKLGCVNVHVIPNPITRAQWQDTEDGLSDLRREKLILAVGSKPLQKGFDLLVKAYAMSNLYQQGWRLKIVGLSDQSRVDLNQLLVGLDVSRLLGLELDSPEKDVVRIYRRSSIFVLASRYEGFPNVLLEAMANGCAVIAFDSASGSRDLIEDGNDGILVSEGDVRSLCRELQRLAEDDGLRAFLGGQAKSVRKRYAIDGVVESWERLLSTRQGSETQCKLSGL